MRDRQDSGPDPVVVMAMAAAIVIVSLVGLVLIEWPVLVWTGLQGDPRLLGPGVVISGGWRLVLGATGLVKAGTVEDAFGVARGVLPPLWVAIVLNVLLVSGLVLLASGGALRVDRWRSRSQMSSASWSPRRKVAKRVWAKPRDLLHLQPRAAWSRSGPIRRAVTGLVRLVAWERRSPAPAGGDSWNLGRLRGAELRSGPEQNALVIAPTGSGKTMGPVTTAVIEHDGPLVGLFNKTDVLMHALAARERRGPVWIYAPMSDLSALGLRSCCWSPLTGCRSWSGALHTAQALFDADPHAAATAAGSGGARFYNTESVQALLPPLLHAAALGDYAMADVLGWLRGGVDALDEPRDVLDRHDVHHAAQGVAGLQQLDERPRSLLLMSGAQLLGAYRHPQVQACDRPGLDMEQVVERNGSVFVIVPDSQQEVLAPLVGAMVGELLRSREQAAQHVRDPRRLPLVKVVADEAAHLAPLRRLPTYLAVSRGWSIRWLLVYQSIAQIQHRYGDEADAVLANATTKLVMGPIHDRSTREELMGVLGDEPVMQTSHTTTAFGSQQSTTRHEQLRPKLAADDLARLAAGEAVLIHGRDVPAVVRLPFWWEWSGVRSPEEAIEREQERRDREEWSR